MKYIFLKVILNFQWFCKNPIRCLVGGIVTVFPIPMSMIFLEGLTLESIKYDLPFLLSTSLIFSVMLFVAGKFLRNFKPPSNWNQNTNELLITIAKWLMVTPSVIMLVIFLIQKTTDGFEREFWLSLISLFSPYGLVGLFLLTREPIVTEYLEENDEQMKGFNELSKTKTFKRMRIATLLMGAQSLVFLFLWLNSMLDSGNLEKEAIMQKFQSQHRIEELENKLDSLQNSINEK